MKWVARYIWTNLIMQCELLRVVLSEPGLVESLSFPSVWHAHVGTPVSSKAKDITKRYDTTYVTERSLLGKRTLLRCLPDGSALVGRVRVVVHKQSIPSNIHLSMLHL